VLAGSLVFLLVVMVVPVVVRIQVRQVREVHQRRARHELLLGQDVVDVVVPGHSETESEETLTEIKR
jgi:glycerol-3-phosphate cytidylyltransferase-like family protein